MLMVYGDFESHYINKFYTLRTMTAYEYILDPRWQTIGCGIAYDEGEPVFLEGDTVADLLRELPRPWAFVSHNSLFDASILAFRYGIHPDLMIDSMGMVRALLLHGLYHGRASLEKVAESLDMPAKGDVVHLVSGLRLEDLRARPRLFEDYKNYCRRDTALCRSIYQHLEPYFPKNELWVMHAVLRMCTQPSFHAEQNHLHLHLAQVQAEKQELLDRVGMTRKDLMSSDKFAAALRMVGVDPPTKPSPTDPSKNIYAFAKTDEGMQDLEEHENPVVQDLAAARLGTRSTLEESRTGRFIRMADNAMQAFGEPWMPVALGYGAAHTHRFGGEWKVNMQNLPSRKSNELRKAFVAPPGHIVLAIDAAQIEARLVAWLAGQTDLLLEFANPGSDVYAWFGSELFGRIITKKTDPFERFASKEIVLGLGFQMGPDKLLWQLATKAAEYGFNVEFTRGQCEVWVKFYRTRFKRIRRMWFDLEQILQAMIDGAADGYRIGPCVVEGTDVVLPNGLRLFYDNIRHENYEKVFTHGRKTKKIYGGKMTENIVQALDRAHVMEAAERIERRAPITKLAHQVHDELVYVPRIEDAHTLGVIAMEEMKRPSWWGAGLPLDAELKVGPSYGELKEISLDKLKEYRL